ncbi:hypothetical protein LWI29_037346 [Acer saccharum]|uniref:non-specific serine/threonine protein kinase n=1 Tax=Acer saccharum TaxID=4024 RepID=A0AA39SZK2_ACESA|nr:hypothetical protein LWI29_037346 [Acer saccharum]
MAFKRQVPYSESCHMPASSVQGGSLSSPLMTHADCSTPSISDSNIENCSKLNELSLSNNILSGNNPQGIGNLLRIFLLDLSFNNLEDELPISLQNKNQPEQFRGNKGLFGQLSQFPLCNSSHSSLFIIPFLIILGFLFLSKRKVKNPKLIASATKNGDLFSIWNYDGKIAFEDIIEAMEDFDIKYCIGIGGYGSVYRAYLPSDLPSGKIDALKKFHHSEFEELVFWAVLLCFGCAFLSFLWFLLGLAVVCLLAFLFSWLFALPINFVVQKKEFEELVFIKSFENEAHALSEIRHQNIVKLHGYCMHRKCMFLIYEYLERGSLYCVLRNNDEAVEFGWFKRVNVIKGIAHALSYLHHSCTPTIVHRDISSNIIY